MPDQNHTFAPGEKVTLLTSFTPDELDLLRQWYNAVNDLAPKYLEWDDHVLNRKILTALGLPAEKGPATDAR